MSHVQTFRDILHLMWFIYPILAAWHVGYDVGKNDSDVDITFPFMFLAIVAQVLLAVGYVYGWNVQ